MSSLSLVYLSFVRWVIVLLEAAIRKMTGYALSCCRAIG